MSSIVTELSVFPETTNPIFQEKYSWVDERLEEMYYGYAITAENYYDYLEAGLLKERYSWVDDALEKQYEETQFIDWIPRPAPLSWVLYRETPIQMCLEDEYRLNRKRAESDISDHEEEVDMAIKRVKNNTPVSDVGCEYNHIFAIADEIESVESDLDGCSEICYASDSSLFGDIYDCNDYDCNGYDSY